MELTGERELTGELQLTDERTFMLSKVLSHSTQNSPPGSSISQAFIFAPHRQRAIIELQTIGELSTHNLPNTAEKSTDIFEWENEELSTVEISSATFSAHDPSGTSLRLVPLNIELNFPCYGNFMSRLHLEKAANRETAMRAYT
jgi:hypothetical protein